jgi:hypothetical protein
MKTEAETIYKECKRHTGAENYSSNRSGRLVLYVHRPYRRATCRF